MSRSLGGSSKADVRDPAGLRELCCGSPLRQKRDELIERTAPTLAHIIVRGIEGFALVFGSIHRQPSQRQFGFSTWRFIEGYGGQQFKWPRWTERMPRQAAVFIRERVDPNKAHGFDDFTINKLGPNDAAVRSAHRAVIRSANPQVHFRHDNRGAFWPPPFLHVLRLGERLPQQFARRIEDARNDGARVCDRRSHDHPCNPAFAVCSELCGPAAATYSLSRVSVCARPSAA